MTERHICDVAIVGGGIAGLWTFHRLHREGFQPVLLETKSLGHGQTIAAQGIIHGGAKYSMHGQISDHTRALGAMPRIWEDSLAGKGEVDLTQARVLARSQHMWSAGGLAQNLGAFFASKLVRSGMSALPEEDWPTVLRNSAFKGKVYLLEELILDTRSVLSALASVGAGRIFQVEKVCPIMERGRILHLQIASRDGRKVMLEAERYLFMAGEGNEAYAADLGFGNRTMQRRPLKMIMARGVGERFYGHCLTASPKPRVTITTHELGKDLVWYLGGEVAERGAKLSDSEAIEFARKEMSALFPWLEWEGIQWGAYSVDRAEPWNEGVLLPPGPTLKQGKNFGIAWPTKMVFAPSLSATVLEWLAQDKVERQEPVSVPLERAGTARFPWEMLWGES